MITADKCGGACGFMDDSCPCETTAVAARRRRMEIRRFKAISSANPVVEQLVSKRLRPLSGISYVPREDGEATLAFCVADGNSAMLGPAVSNERRQENSTPKFSAYESVRGRDPKRAASSPSTVWERPIGDICAVQSSSNRDTTTLDRESMSSGSMCGDRTSSAQFYSETDMSSTVTFSQGDRSLPRGLDEVGTIGTVETISPSVTNSKWGEVVSSTLINEHETLAEGEMTNLDQHAVSTILHPPGSRYELAVERVMEEVSSGVPLALASSPSTRCVADNSCPAHGMVSLCGRRREMEDAVAAVPTFMTLPCNVVGGCNCDSPSTSGLLSALHFFGVYDGHGGSQAANFCADHLHHALAEEVNTSVQGENANEAGANWEERWQRAISLCFLRMDAEVGGVCWRGGQCGQADSNPRYWSEPIAPETVGSTAVIAVIGSCQIIVGNCGDSRAVLSRGGVAIPLSVDHKPEREDEMARIEAAGGRVIYWNGYRVLGVLAMSRAIGDRYLKPYVIAEPEVTCMKRSEDDECLVLASDGLWDVMSNDAVCDITRRALNCRHRSSTAAVTGWTVEEETPAAQTAALLTKLALAKGSSDNISVVVVDLKHNSSR